MRRQEINVISSTQSRPFTRPDKTKIPMHVMWSSYKQPEKLSPKQEKSPENTMHHGLSVAARKARLQKQDSPVQLKPRNNNLSTSSIETRSVETKKLPWTTNMEPNRQWDRRLHNWLSDSEHKEKNRWDQTRSCENHSEEGN